MDASRRRTVVLAIVIGVVPFFAVVNAVVHSVRENRQAMAVDWASRGDRDLRAGRADRAAEDFRAAQEYARDSDAYRLQLAEALLAGNHPSQARGQLLTLWAGMPGDGYVNLELARAAAREDDTTEAVRWYHAAIDGAWPTDAAASRRTARFELARYLLSRGDTTKAQAELIALIDDLPPNSDLIVDTADLLLKAGASQRAAALLDRALALDPHNDRALRLAGEAAFARAEYRDAARYLADAANAGPPDPADERLRRLSTRVLALDPSARGVSSRERVRRVVALFGIAGTWLDRCPPDSNADVRARAEAARPQVSERTLARDPDAVDDTMALVTDMESAAEKCGAPDEDQAALQLVLKERRSAS